MIATARHVSPGTGRVALHSKQLVSRYDSERNLRPRLTCILGRQLERYREMSHVWGEQSEAVRCVLSRKDQDVQAKNAEVNQLLADRERAEKAYTQKYDALVRGLSEEQDKALIRAQEKRRELERSLEEERKTTQVLAEEESKNLRLRTTLDQTVAQLDEVTSNMQQCEMQVHEWNSGRPLELASPELQVTMSRIEDASRHREQIRLQSKATLAEVMLAQEELNRQRAYSARLEDFVRRVSAGGGKYCLDAASKREACRLLTAANRLRAAASTTEMYGGHQENLLGLKPFPP